MMLQFSVNGEIVDLQPDTYNTLRELVVAALTISMNTNRPFEEWELRNEQGQVITDLSHPAVSLYYNFVLGTRLYLTLKVGALG